MKSAFCVSSKKSQTEPSSKFLLLVGFLGAILCQGVSNLYCGLGTAILLKPGIIFGGTLQHDCPTSRAIGYFLEPVIMLAPFAKKPMNITLKGITTDEHDLSVYFTIYWKICSYLCVSKVDILRTVTLPHLQQFGISEGLELRVCEILYIISRADLERN